MAAPLYEGLAATLRAAVTSGAYQQGDRLPGEAELQETHGVSRGTVRAALAVLAREGLILPAQGRGWYVRPYRTLVWDLSRPENATEADVSPSDAWSRGVREQDRIPSERTTVSNEVPEPHIGELLGMPDGVAVVRRRHRYVDGELYVTDDSYYPRPLVAGTPIELPGDVLPGTYAIFAARGHGWIRREFQIVSRPATREESERFSLGVGVSVAEVTQVRHAADDRPVAVSVTIAPGDRVVIKGKGEA